jgi:hypothetical protein
MSAVHDAWKQREAAQAVEPTPTPQRYRFISDPGHGWLEVPMAEVRALGIRPSSYSYVSPDGTFAYLEEDCDAALFTNARHAIGKRTEFTEVIQNYDSPIRNYRRFA